jgi:sporulation protein YlmC with PRC-barrel domain
VGVTGKQEEKANMKQTTQQALCAAIAAFTLGLMPGRSSAQQNTTTADPPKPATPSRVAGKMLGRVCRADKFIGKEVIGTDNQHLGKINNLAVDLNSDRILYVVVSSGGFLGVEERRFAAPPAAFTETENAETVQISADKQKLEGAPRFTSQIDKPEKMADPDFLSQVYQYFGQKAPGEGALSGAEVQRASTLIGTSIDNNANERLGKVEDMGIDLKLGRAVFFILNPDYRLDLGGNYYALPASALSWNSLQKRLNCGDVSKDKLGSAPHFATDNWPDLSNPSYATQVYTYYGKELFENKMRPTGRSEETPPKQNQ